ncbi:MAG: hypothetical protein SGARI_000790, partial [Bacillariaceae sp.]
MADLLSHARDDDRSGIFSASTWMDSCNNAEDVLYHDILVNVFEFLDAQSLKTFSETARRCNYEVFYYLQLQLQQALLVGDGEQDDNHETAETRTNESTQRNQYALAGSAFLSRLAILDTERAQKVVSDYLQSNSTLRTMPLSHSLAYARRYLMHNGFSKMFPHSNGDKENDNGTGNKALTSAALFMTVVGAASLVSTVSGGDPAAIAASIDSFGSELPNVLFRVGVMGGLMGAAKQMTDTEQRAAMKEKAENMTKSMRESLMRGKSQNEEKREDAQQVDPSEQCEHTVPSHYRLPSLFEMRDKLQTALNDMAASELEQNRDPLLLNPYDHLPTDNNNPIVEHNGDEAQPEDKEAYSAEAKSDRKMPSGCVGAYARAIRASSDQVTVLVKEARRTRFQAHGTNEQRQLSLDFLNACASNDTLETVKEMVQSMNVDGFFLGNDGSETCALHTAAFNGADQV